MWNRISALTLAICVASARKPNILLFLTDDQDPLMDSVKHQQRMLDLIAAEGVTVSNHYATVSQCCPSRASLLRGQASHNTNITNVDAPGGNYDKWTLSGEDMDYLPYWMGKAGYRTEYIGKLLNGLSIFNYDQPKPRGWDHIDVLLDPYMYEYNNVVMSENGARPVSYHEYHQSDVIRAKALDRLEYLLAQDQPFYLQLAPTAPHDQSQANLAAVPPARYANEFTHLKDPRNPNFNTLNQAQQDKKPTWWKKLPVLNDTLVASGDAHYQRRIQSLQGIDDIVEDVIKKLADEGALDNTYIIYTTDNGYHIGMHRDLGGKTSPYREGTDLPFFVRGPGIPSGAFSKIPSTHIDLAPTFLDIAGVAKSNWPIYLDGQSLLSQWRYPTRSPTQNTDAREILNIEYWGGSRLEAPPYVFAEGTRNNNSYKTLRIVNEGASWLYSIWCTNDTELYNTCNDPWELDNLADDLSEETQRVKQRLNALLMITKSCAQSSCRNPWAVMDPSPLPRIHSFAQSLHNQYDHFFATFPTVSFQECLMVQAAWNEGPYYPEESISLGVEYRTFVSNYTTKETRGMLVVPNNTFFAGAWDQRHADLATIMKSSRVLTNYELGLSNGTSA